MKVTFNLEKRFVYGILGMIILFAGIVAVYAYGTSNPSNMGHTIGEMNWNSNITTVNAMNYCLRGNCISTWPSSSSGGGIGACSDCDSRFQREITESCSTGQAIRVINNDGTVSCQSVSGGTTYSAGTGISLSGTTFSADTSYLQRRVSTSCSSGQAIQSISSTGLPTCVSVGSTITCSCGTCWNTEAYTYTEMIGISTYSYPAYRMCTPAGWKTTYIDRH